ncbi:MAG TPA: SEC-C metal-binding domain-containing protein [Candidatus Nanoarchaeia archaeon]|nr:SEC-C metal-binding domain-containing protein [Candidatus Nanoarchaeia archaeon]
MEKGKKVNIKDVRKRMWEADDDLEIEFRCNKCNKKQRIKPGLIKKIGKEEEEEITYEFENEIMCKNCHSNDIELTEEGINEIEVHTIGMIYGNKKGVLLTEGNVYVENKKMKHCEAYDYILKRIKEESLNGELYLRAGNVACMFNKYSEAINYYEKSLELNPKLLGSLMNLVGIFEYRYTYYKIEDAKVTASFYLEEMANLFRTQDFDDVTIRNKHEIVQFMGEKAESLGVHIPELIQMPKLQLSKSQFKARKLGRNEPCHCGSGKKYKKCCLKI